MKNNVLKLPFWASLFLCCNSYAQSNNLGVGEPTPGSKLTVNGSFAAAYQTITTNAYSISENDFYVIWKGTATGTITLPASTTGVNRKGRLYFFKNNSDTYPLTINAAGTELIDDTAVFTLLPGGTALLVKTDINTATGITYNVAQLTQGKPGYVYHVSSVATETHAQAAFVTLNYNMLNLSTNNGSDFNLTTDTWTCPRTGYYRIEATEFGSTGTANVAANVEMVILKNTTQVAYNYYTLVNLSNTNVVNSGTVTCVLYLTKDDQISAQKVLCSGCGAANMSSRHRQMIITGLQ
jgi:hypothetical protein